MTGYIIAFGVDIKVLENIWDLDLLEEISGPIKKVDPEVSDVSYIDAVPAVEPGDGDVLKFAGPLSKTFRDVSTVIVRETGISSERLRGSAQFPHKREVSGFSARHLGHFIAGFSFLLP